MSQATPTMASASPYEQVCSAEQASAYSAAQIREAIAYWVGHDRLDIADALVAAGMGLYPESEDILAIGALLAEINQDWAQAQDCLERLMAVQGQAATAESFFHLVRVMRCRSSLFSAYRTAQRGLEKHPQHAGLNQELTELTELLEVAPVSTQVEAHAA